MDFFEVISFAKLFSLAFGGSITLTEAELEAAAGLLKKMSDARTDWIPQQIDAYKKMVDFAKEYSKERQHG